MALFHSPEMTSKSEMVETENKSKPKSYDEHLFEIVFEMVDKELQSNQQVLTSVCKGLSENFSEVCHAVKDITDNISTIQSTQTYVLERLDEIQKEQVNLKNSLTELKDEMLVLKTKNQESLDAMEQEQIKNQSIFEKFTHQIEDIEEKTREISLPSESKLKWGSTIKVIPETPLHVDNSCFDFDKGDQTSHKNEGPKVV